MKSGTVQVHPYLNFGGNTEEAFNFYKSVFGGEFSSLMRFKDFGENTMNVPSEDLDKIANIALPLGNGNILMGTDALESLGQSVTFGNNFHIFLEAGGTEEAEVLFNVLSQGGKVEMPLQKTEWAEKYGSCTDKFGVQWMVNYTGNVSLAGTSEG